MRVATGCFLALHLLFAGIANATGTSDSLRPCLEMEGKAPSGEALECYRQAARELLGQTAPAKTDAAPKSGHNHSLAGEWAPSDKLLNIHRQNYFLFYSHSSDPNNAPTSPNPRNQVPASYPLDEKEMKFQISVKSHFLGEGRHTLWFAYTQLSFYQIYDSEHSNPFRESNYEPEIIYSYRPENLGLGAAGNTSFLNAGIVHQSNGQTLPRSRSWNRFYLQAGVERDFGGGRKLVLLPRWWKRLGGGGIDDDNPDITHYLGQGDLELRYHHDGAILCALARIHSLQLDLALPASALLPQIHNTNLHLQYFNGYGESLIDYNQRHSTFGVGISMPFD